MTVALFVTSYWKHITIVTVLAVAIVVGSLATTTYSTTSKTAALFIAGIALTILTTVLYGKRATQDHRVLFPLWFLPLSGLLLSSRAIANMVEDKFFWWQGLALPCALIAAVYIAVVLLYLLGSTGRSAVSTFRGTALQPRRTLALALQSYLATALAMAACYAGVEEYSHGAAFAGMHPEWPSQSAALRELGPSHPIWKEAADAYNRYVEATFAPQVDALYFSVITSATVGYGDIYPRWRILRLLVIGQILVSQFILVVLVGVVFARFSQQPDGGPG